MKTSCIRHPAKEPLIIMRKWQREYCNGDMCAAALLSYFEYWHNYKLDNRVKNKASNSVSEAHGEKRTQDESLWQFHTGEEIEEGMLGLYEKKRIRKSILFLEEKGAIKVSRNPNPKYAYDRTKFFYFNERAINSFLDKYVQKTQEMENDEGEENREDQMGNSIETNGPIQVDKSPNVLTQKSRTIPETSSEITRENSSEKENSDFFNSSLGQGTEPLHPSPTPTTFPPSSLPMSGEEKIRAHLLNRVRVVPSPTTPIPLSSLSVREVLLTPLDKSPDGSEDCPLGWSYKKDAPKRREDLTEEYVRNLYKYENGLKRTLGEKHAFESREETITFLEALWEPKKAIPQSLPHPKALGGMLRQLGKEKSMP